MLMFIVEREFFHKKKNKMYREYIRYSSGTLKLMTLHEANVYYDAVVELMPESNYTIIGVDEDEIAWNNELYRDG